MAKESEDVRLENVNELVVDQTYRTYGMDTGRRNLMLVIDRPTHHP